VSPLDTLVVRDAAGYAVRRNTWEIPMAYTIKVNDEDHTTDVG
jgi:hypothetical protein